MGSHTLEIIDKNLVMMATMATLCFRRKTTMHRLLLSEFMFC